MLIPLALSQAIIAGQGGQSAASSILRDEYNPRHEVTFTGVITGKTKGQAPGYAQGMSILVRSGKNIREVELGPAWYVGRQEAGVKLGDKVTVKAVPLTIDKKERIFLARQLWRGKSVLALRDEAGMPYWIARRDRVAMNGKSGAAMRMKDMGKMYKGTVGDMTTFDVNGEQYAGYVLNTPDGPVNVALAPKWYWDNQPSYFNSGDNVTLYGDGSGTRVGGSSVPNSTNYGGGVVLVNSGYYNGGSFMLRPGGNPVYGGFYNGAYGVNNGHR